jgi:hypothetical protein
MHFDYEIGFQELIDKIEEFWFAQSFLTLSFSSLNAFYSEPLDKIAIDEDRNVILLNDRLLLTTPSSVRVAIVIEEETDVCIQFAVYDLGEVLCSCKEDFEMVPDYKITISKED